MKIGLDMDEVLCDLLSEYIKFLNSEYDMSLSQKHFNGYYAWDTWKGTIEEKIKLFDEFYKSKYFKNIKPIKEAVDHLLNLKNNHKLYIITSRPDYLKIHTRNWIKKYFPETFSGIYFTNYILNKKKSDICKKIGIEIMIEDSVDYALDCSLYNIKVILLSYPWNKLKIANDKI